MKFKMTGRSKQLRGFMAADCIIALAVVAILASALAVAVSRENLAEKRLAEQRACTRLAEQTILALQTGQTSPAAPDGVKVSVKKIEAQGELPTGMTWVTIS